MEFGSKAALWFCVHQSNLETVLLVMHHFIFLIYSFCLDKSVTIKA